MKILQFFYIYRPRQTPEGMIELSVRHPPVFIKLKSGLTNNKYWEQQFFRVSGEWECPKGHNLPENRRMAQTWQLLRSDRCELPSIRKTDRDNVTKISDWSAAREKLEKFEEIDFDKLVTDETLRQFLGHKIQPNKKTMTKRGTAKRKDDAPRSPRPAAKRTSEATALTPKEAPLKKKKNIPLAASGARRTPPERQEPETNTKEGSMSFRGFVSEAPPHQGEGSLPPFGLRDETSSEALHHGSEIPFEEPEGAAFGATSPKSLRTGEGAEPTPEPSPR
jgi:hypothetical protein